MKPHDPRNGFTLIELMVVITIIGILAALSVGVANVAVQSTRRTAAEATIQKLQSALDMYHNHCGRYPPTPEERGKNADIIGVLTGDTDHNSMYDPDSGDIPRNHPVWRGPYLPFDSKNTDSGGNLIDPWGQPYRYYNNESEAPRFKVHPNSYLLYSCGRDGQATDATREEVVNFKLPYNKDNVKNWEDE
jgi:general secretion pathway protein G